MIQYAGDPFVDTGVAVLEHRLQKPCDEFSQKDLLLQGAELIELYSTKIWRGILSVHFPNSGWTNPTMGAANVAEFHKKVLQGFQRQPNAVRNCEYCGKPSHAVVDGSIIPLLSSANSMDCSPGGRTGFAVCGYCLFAMQFYPLATLKVEGKALFWWSHQPEWTFLLAGVAVDEVGRFIAAAPDGSIKPRFPWSRLLIVARTAFERWRSQPEQERISLQDVVGCHVTNYRTGPEFDELRIPRELFQFWDEAASRFGKLYQDAVEQAWESKPAKGGKTDKGSETEWERRNGLYEALGAAFRSEDFRSKAVFAARSYFIRLNKTTPQPGSFELACLFLERLAGMQKNRIKAIKEIGDRIADCRDSEKVLKRLYTNGRIVEVLVYAQGRLRDAGESPLSLDTILLALDMVSADDSFPRDMWLARDLIILRTLEKIDAETLARLPEPNVESPAAGTTKEE